MSSYVQQEIKCPCGEVFEAEVCQSVSVSREPDLKDRVLGGQFNVVQCPRCQQMIYAEHFVLFHDSSQELMAFVYPPSMESETEKIRVVMGNAFKRLQDESPPEQQMRYQPFLLFGLDALCDLLNIEEEILDEMKIVQALCDSMKLAYRRLHFDAARKNNVPAILPLNAPAEKNAKVSIDASRALEGVRKILESNPYHAHYKRFLQKLEVGWFLKDSDFV